MLSLGLRIRLRLCSYIPATVCHCILVHLFSPYIYTYSCTMRILYTQ